MSFTRVLRKTSRAFWTEFKSNRQVSCYCKRRAESKHEKLLINRRETWLTQISRQRRRRPLVRRPQLLCPSRASPQRPSTARAVPRIALANDDIVSASAATSEWSCSSEPEIARVRQRREQQRHACATVAEWEHQLPFSNSSWVRAPWGTFASRLATRCLCSWVSELFRWLSSTPPEDL